MLCVILSCYYLQEARKAIKALNGKIALSKKLSVRYAHVQKEVS